MQRTWHKTLLAKLTSFRKNFQTAWRTWARSYQRRRSNWVKREVGWASLLFSRWGRSEMWLASQLRVSRRSEMWLASRLRVSRRRRNVSEKLPWIHLKARLRVWTFKRRFCNGVILDHLDHLKNQSTIQVVTVLKLLRRIYLKYLL